jgi:hypothetical protein
MNRKFALSTCGAANATSITFTDRAVFNANATVTLSENFESLSGTVRIPGPFTAPSGVTLSSGREELFSIAPGHSTNPTEAFGVDAFGDVLSISLGSHYTAFGVDLLQSFGVGAQLSEPSFYFIQLLDSAHPSQAELFRASVAPNGGSFFGLISTQPFDSISVQSLGPFPQFIAGNEVIDNIALGSAGAPVGVPGPAVGTGLPGLLAGLVAILAWYRRRRAAV